MCITGILCVEESSRIEKSRVGSFPCSRSPRLMSMRIHAQTSIACTVASRFCPNIYFYQSLHASVFCICMHLDTACSLHVTRVRLSSPGAPKEHTTATATRNRIVQHTANATHDSSAQTYFAADLSRIPSAQAFPLGQPAPSDGGGYVAPTLVIAPDNHTDAASALPWLQRRIV